jgi:hypothetical protein
MQNINESQRKSPTQKHILRQSAFRSSFAPSTSFGGVTAKSYLEGKSKAKKGN